MIARPDPQQCAVDAEEKRAVGAVWASRSGGRCLFVMPTEGDFSVITKMVRPLYRKDKRQDTLTKAADSSTPYGKDKKGA